MLAGKIKFKTISKPIGRMAERALFFALSGGILGLIIGLLIFLYGYLHRYLNGLPAGGEATYEAVALGILSGMGTGLFLAIGGRVVIGISLAAFAGWIVGASLNLFGRDQLHKMVGSCGGDRGGNLGCERRQVSAT
jgi:hypothetical protein